VLLLALLVAWPVVVRQEHGEDGLVLVRGKKVLAAAWAAEWWRLRSWLLLVLTVRESVLGQARVSQQQQQQQ
jgi:hypothetical protein